MLSPLRRIFSFCYCCPRVVPMRSFTLCLCSLVFTPFSPLSISADSLLTPCHLPSFCKPVFRCSFLLAGRPLPSLPPPLMPRGVLSRSFFPCLPSDRPSGSLLLWFFLRVLTLVPLDFVPAARFNGVLLWMDPVFFSFRSLTCRR